MRGPALALLEPELEELKGGLARHAPFLRKGAADSIAARIPPGRGEGVGKGLVQGKMVPRWPKMVPRWLQDGPRWPQDGPKMGSSWPQDSPEWPTTEVFPPTWAKFGPPMLRKYIFLQSL